MVTAGKSCNGHAKKMEELQFLDDNFYLVTLPKNCNDDKKINGDQK